MVARPGSSAQGRERETVVLVHGLWMAGWVLALQGLRIGRCGFDVRLFSYPSVGAGLAENVQRLSRFTAAIDAPRLHFVGHSLGGLLILALLDRYPDTRTGRVVLLGSPYGGSRVARTLARTAAGRMLLGRTMLDWLDADKPEVAEGREIGVLAGSRSLGAGRLICRLDAPNDGVVTVEETRVPAMGDQVVLRVSHSEMLFSRRVAEQVCAFLKSGRFAHS